MPIALGELRKRVVFVQRESVVVAMLAPDGTLQGRGSTESQALQALESRAKWILAQARAGVMPTEGESTVNWKKHRKRAK